MIWWLRSSRLFLDGAWRPIRGRFSPMFASSFSTLNYKSWAATSSLNLSLDCSRMDCSLGSWKLNRCFYLGWTCLIQNMFQPHMKFFLDSFVHLSDWSYFSWRKRLEYSIIHSTNKCSIGAYCLISGKAWTCASCNRFEAAVSPSLPNPRTAKICTFAGIA